MKVFTKTMQTSTLSLSRYFGRVEGAGESIFWVFKEPTI